jgi:hypothetical protein
MVINWLSKTLNPRVRAIQRSGIFVHIDDFAQAEQRERHAHRFLSRMVENNHINIVQKSLVASNGMN